MTPDLDLLPLVSDLDDCDGVTDGPPVCAAVDPLLGGSCSLPADGHRWHRADGQGWHAEPHTTTQPSLQGAP